MSVHTTIPLQCNLVKPDDILTLAPNCKPDTAEYEHRAKLRSYRNAASAMIAATDCSEARSLAWMATDAITRMIYAPAHCEELAELGHFARRLMVTAMQAEQLRDKGLLP